MQGDNKGVIGSNSENNKKCIKSFVVIYMYFDQHYARMGVFVYKSRGLIVCKPNKISKIRNIINMRNFNSVQDSEFTITQCTFVNPNCAPREYKYTKVNHEREDKFAFTTLKFANLNAFLYLCERICNRKLGSPTYYPCI